MADPKEENLFDDVEDLEAEADAAEEALDDVDLDSDGPARAPRGPNVDAIVEERDELRDRLMRALAEMENLRKRAERERREAEQYGGSKLARDMLPIYDNLKRALDVVTDEQRDVAGPLIEGVELTLREVVHNFANHGIDLIAPQVGDRFDPQEHQAMFEAPVPDTKAGDIIQVMAEGFRMKDRLLRPAQVGVSSTPG